MGRKELFYFDFFSVRPTEITGKNNEQHFDIKKMIKKQNCFRNCFSHKQFKKIK